MKKYKTDIIIIGSGIAGLNFALNVPENLNVIILTKSLAKDANTYLAQGGIAGVISSVDCDEKYINDVMNAGKGLSIKKAVEKLAFNSKEAILQLNELGVNFDIDKKNKTFDLGREGAHSLRRIAHVGSHTGQTIENVLFDCVKEKSNVKILEKHYVVELLKDKQNSRIAGCLVFKKTTSDFEVYLSKAVVLSTGGLGALYKYTVNSNVSAGDGITLAYNSGCSIRDLEFIQFHPTALNKKKKPPLFLISEALRGEGGRLVKRKKNSTKTEYIMSSYPRKDLESRDIVSMEIFKTIHKGYNVFLDMTDKERKWLQNRFLNIYQECLKYDIDISKDLIPVISAAHYSCGGIKVDLKGQTGIKGLFAVGETASTGVHGANRLASTSLSESFIFSKFSVKSAVSYIKRVKFSENFDISLKIKNIPIYSLKKNKLKKIQNIDKELGEIMWEYAGIIRDTKGLKTGIKKLNKLKNKLKNIKNKGFNVKIYQMENKIFVSELIILSCLKRKESRGCHFLSDYPVTKKKAIHTILKKSFF